MTEKTIESGFSQGLCPEAKKLESIKELGKRHHFLCDQLLDSLYLDYIKDAKGVELLYDILCADDDFEAGVREKLPCDICPSNYAWPCLETCGYMELRRVLGGEK